MRRFSLAALALVALAPSASSLAQTEIGPTRRPGWWEMQELIRSGPTTEPVRRTVHICTDPAVDKVKSPLEVNLLGRFCHEKAVRSAAGWTVSGGCESSDVRITQQAVATGDLNDRYQVEILTLMASPPSAAGAETRMSVDARWVGQCPAGKKPGDTEGYPPPSGL